MVEWYLYRYYIYLLIGSLFRFSLIQKITTSIIITTSMMMSARAARPPPTNMTALFGLFGASVMVSACICMVTYYGRNYINNAFTTYFARQHLHQ